ncbi:MAG: HIT family protein [Rhodospirillales bacterium]|nr:HIT family protein [Rhodospirillales bacterium]MBO6785883.1 HIT family protein [Rhodospirillales bacterium]
MFELHPTLEKDSIPVTETDGLLIRLINDARFPWLLIVPKVDGATELHDLTDHEYAAVMAMARSLGKVLKHAFDADKINTAAIGNMVPQLHIHVVARTRGDDAWPGPVWGAGTMVPMSDDEAARRIGLVRSALG